MRHILGQLTHRNCLTKYCRGPQRKSLGDMGLDEGDTGSPSHMAHAHGSIYHSALINSSAPPHQIGPLNAF